MVATKLAHLSTKTKRDNRKPRPPPKPRSSRSVKTRYLSRRRRGPSASDRKGEIYMLEGRFGGKVFVKVGRSVDYHRRFEQHRKTCKRVVWREIGNWPAPHCHKAVDNAASESCIHLKLELAGFTRTNIVCCCGTQHEEWFELTGHTIEYALGIAQRIILGLHEVTHAASARLAGTTPLDRPSSPSKPATKERKYAPISDVFPAFVAYIYPSYGQVKPPGGLGMAKKWSSQPVQESFASRVPM
ncbi:hypothetical protein PQX77_015889 [Marasmius sp. AFHP31]|nr:hypothetical protein PQX77_016223 [Marasmius sp. AFHP31]KAK1221306.1 hypothetical protein PQX77_015889 [Marasmius sp. AFHP31]